MISTMLHSSLQREHSECFTVKSIQCCYCGNTWGDTLRGLGPYRMMKCSHCGFIYLTPRPTEEDLRTYYRHHYLPQDPGSIDKWSRMMRAVFLKAADQIEKHCTRGRVLDIGCGFGFFLKEMRERGWEVTGLEMSLSGISYARNTFKLPVLFTEFEKADLPEGHFDVIAAFYVIEHAYNPLLFLQRVHALLKPKGVVILRYPHTHLLEYLLTLLGIENNVYDIPFHLSDFSPQTIERFLIKAGFSDCRHFIGGHTLPEKYLHRVSSSIFGTIAEILFQLSFKTYLLPGVSKSIIARKN